MGIGGHKIASGRNLLITKNHPRIPKRIYLKNGPIKKFNKPHRKVNQRKGKFRQPIRPNRQYDRTKCFRLNRKA